MLLPRCVMTERIVSVVMMLGAVVSIPSTDGRVPDPTRFGLLAARLVLGTVQDTGGRPVPQASVLIDGRQMTEANSQGQFRVEVSSEREIIIEVRRIGFEPSRIALPRGGGDTSVVVTLTPLAQPLPQAVVEARQSGKLARNGFYQRMADREKGINTGHFVTEAEIARRNPSRFMQLLEAINGVQVRRVGSCFVTHRCWVPQGSGGCFMEVYLDGKRLNRARFDPKENPWESTDYPDELLSPGAVGGIEVYSRANKAPPEYQTVGGCGVILVWTR
jgi:hypothetical protein